MAEETKQADVKPGELLADTDKDLVGSSVMISYSRKGHSKRSSNNSSSKRQGGTPLTCDGATQELPRWRDWSPGASVPHCSSCRLKLTRSLAVRSLLADCAHR